MLKLISLVHFYFLMWLLDIFTFYTYVAHIIFLLESTAPKILEYWKQFKMFRKTASPPKIHIALHFPEDTPTYPYPTICITYNLPNLVNLKLKALAVKELQSSLTTSSLELQNYSHLYRRVSNFCRLLPLEQIQVLAELFLLLWLSSFTEMNCRETAKKGRKK